MKAMLPCRIPSDHFEMFLLLALFTGKRGGVTLCSEG